MRAAGADGCPKGWICVSRELGGGPISSTCFRTAAELLGQRPVPKVLGIDIPIGLPSKGPRECDREARRLLGRPRAASVFPAPIRPLLRARSWEEAAASLSTLLTALGLSARYLCSTSNALVTSSAVGALEIWK